MRKIKQGDQVVVMTGKNKGKQGSILRVINGFNKQGKKVTRVIVEGINMVKKHVRGNPQMEKPGGIIEKEAPIDASNVMHVDTQGKPSRVGIRTLEDGRKVRYFKTNQEVIDG